MQQINYLCLQNIATLLNTECTGSRCIYCFTQQKDELVIFLKRNKERYYLRIGCRGDLQYIVPQNEYRRAHKNTLNLFPEIEKKVLQKVECIGGERIIILYFEGGYTLVLKMHGNRSNVLLLENEKVHSIFRSTIEEDLAFDLPKPVAATYAVSSLENLKAQHPYFDKHLLAQLNYFLNQTDNLNHALQQTLALATTPPYYVVETPQQEIGFLLTPPTEEFKVIFEGNLFDSLQKFLQLYYGRRAYIVLKKKIGERVQTQYLAAKHRLFTAQQSVQKLERRRSAEEIANLIMANLHAIPTGMAEVELFDFYTDKNISIPLNPKLSPQENARLLYQKHKDRRKKLEYIQSTLSELELEYLKWAEIKTEFETQNNTRTLQAFAKKYAEYLELNQAINTESFPFRIFYYGKYAIWVGKNAQNNDLLTFAYAKKNDIWLHARDTPGSHVIVRKPTRQNIPPDVIEYAAGIAAYFSKQRQAQYVPVHYTERRYLRKHKKLAVGQVLVDKENVLVVEPIKPDEI